VVEWGYVNERMHMDEKRREMGEREDEIETDEQKDGRVRFNDIANYLPIGHA
jgi:hypothetical protein